MGRSYIAYERICHTEFEYTLFIIFVTEAVQAIWALSFDENNRAVMVQDDKLDLISILDKMRDSENRLISKAAHGTIWNLRHLLQNSKVEKFRNIGSNLFTLLEQR